MKLSVIVPVYNMAADGKLEYCMNSLVGQTLSDMEIIAVDDASTDNSVEILRAYEKQYPGRVRVLCHDVNKRQGGAKNTGLGAARGEWIGFIDSDDWVTPDYYEKLLAKAEETGADMVGCDYNLVSEHTFQVGQVVENNTADQTGELDEEKHSSLIRRFGSMVVKIYKHSVIKEKGLCFPEGIFYEDNCAGPLWSLLFTRFERVPEPMYYYYQHVTSTVHRISEERCRDRMRAEVCFYKECEERGFLERYHQAIEYNFTELYFVNTLFSYMAGVEKPRLAFVKELYQGLIERFPDFAENPYYIKETGGEEKEWIAMLGKNPAAFYVYYRFKFWVRSILKKWRKV